ncbi:MAG: hypothetical protein LBD31_00275 [Treponema sp.]|jgi:hypothetical protein|nr:hypothetical protein [Treponema sp.]
MTWRSQGAAAGNFRKRFGLPILLAGLAFFSTQGYAQNAEEREAVALVPFWGDDEGVAVIFGGVLNQTLAGNPRYRPIPIDMNNLPPDVPEGGYPPYVCPSPSLVKGSPYALTGEIVLDDNGLYHLRLYLYEMENVRLLCSDELTARDRSECGQYLPSLLEWLFSWIPRPAPADGAEEAGAENSGDTEVQAPPRLLPAAEEKRLYLGLRAGTSLRFYSRDRADPFIQDKVHDYYNISAAFQAAWQFSSFFALQGEAIWTTDYASFSYSTSGVGSFTVNTDPIRSSSIMFPLLLKGVFRRDSSFVSIFGGAFFILPLGEMSSTRMGKFAYTLTLPLGYTLGAGMGVKAGPGFIFFDLRWAADLGGTVTRAGELVYKRSMVSLSAGYELGFFSRRSGKKTSRDTPL